VRDNGGGDDPLWQQGLMEHITRMPYTQAGRYVVRVTKKNADPGDVIGEVQRLENKKRIDDDGPDPDRAPALLARGVAVSMGGVGR
jgi:hypothetical protein